MSNTAMPSPFADFRAIVGSMPGPDQCAIDAVRERDGQLTKPAGALGRLENLVEWLAGWQAKTPPTVQKPLVAVFAANHGVAAKGVSAYPSDVTKQMVANFAAGGAAINQLCKMHDIGLRVFELALEMPTPDISEQDAFTEQECAATMAFGMESIAGGTDLLCLGEMGIGNTTVAAAIYHALYGGEAADWVGRGTGIDDEGLERKRAVVSQIVERLDGEKDPLEILRRAGGREIAAMAGAILAARVQRIPVIVDGFIATSAAAIVHAMGPGAIDHCLIAHASAEAGHAAVVKRLDKRPVVDLDMRLGEGSGAALAAVILKSAVGLHTGMATFAEAGVSGPADE
ncbi:nicotinate-nucleotide--dimethylbenzimidazole phosphoribosyltransferase [Coralliovum pocilloporae]|uniref:nicotinate-nucleotide--dimethylbenzimidazole phosphoribosyltransferase n=1 Tax=Coralliovum pocilloporae TaxID=3066369 RepID=UPI0033078911